MLVWVPGLEDVDYCPSQLCYSLFSAAVRSVDSQVIAVLLSAFLSLFSGVPETWFRAYSLSVVISDDQFRYMA